MYVPKLGFEALGAWNVFKEVFCYFVSDAGLDKVGAGCLHCTKFSGCAVAKHMF